MVSVMKSANILVLNQINLVIKINHHNEKKRRRKLEVPGGTSQGGI